MEDLFEIRARRRMGQLKTLATKAKPMKSEISDEEAMELAREVEERVVELEDLDARMNAESVEGGPVADTTAALSEMPHGAYYVPETEARMRVLHLARMSWMRSLQVDSILRTLEGAVPEVNVTQMKKDRAQLTKEIGSLVGTPKVHRAYQMHFAYRLPQMIAARKARKVEQALDMITLREMSLEEGRDEPLVKKELQHLGRERKELEGVMEKLLSDKQTYFHFVRNHANDYQHSHQHYGRVRCPHCSTINM